MDVIILSGVGSSGKTTMFNLLKDKLDCFAVSEYASTVIKRRLREGRTLPWEKPYNKYSWEGFEHEMYGVLSDAFTTLSKLQKRPPFAVFDRASEDILGYCMFNEVDTSRWWKSTKSWFNFMEIPANYHVFMFKPLVVQNDSIRNLDYDRDKEYNSLIASSRAHYTEDEFFIEEKPGTIEERLNWVLSKISK